MTKLPKKFRPSIAWHIEQGHEFHRLTDKVTLILTREKNIDYAPAYRALQTIDFDAFLSPEDEEK